MRDNGLDVVEPTRDAEREWSDHAQEVAYSTLFPQSAIWYMGGLQPYRQKCAEIAGNEYEGFTFTSPSRHSV